jgi:uncharacterized membrane protein
MDEGASMQQVDFFTLTTTAVPGYIMLSSSSQQRHTMSITNLGPAAVVLAVLPQKILKGSEKFRVCVLLKLLFERRLSSVPKTRHR